MWIILTLISALAMAGRLAVSKSLSTKFTALFQTWLMFIFALPLIILYVIPTYEGIPLDNFYFILTTFISTLGFITANILIIKATELSPLSLTVPFLAVTPIPAILIEFIVLGILPSIYGALGILLVAVGGYVLNASESKKGILEPIKAIAQEKGSILAILAAVAFSIGGTLSKYAVAEANETAFIATWAVINIIVATPLVLACTKCKTQIKNTFNKNNFAKIFSMGSMFAVAYILYTLAVAMTNASYVLALKRTSGLFGVFIGWLIFKEVKITERMAGAIIMVAGVALIAVLG